MRHSPTRNDLLLTDFATIFAHMWYRDFPFQRGSRGKLQRATWTTHIGIAVRTTADLMGLFTHFESGRTDAVLKDNHDNAVAALEWEWSALHRGDEVVNEFEKLKNRCVEFPGIRFACLIGYARSGSISARNKVVYCPTTILDDYKNRWDPGLPPLLLVVVHFENLDRQFMKITIDEIKEGNKNTLREQPAYPWEVKGSRWEPPETGK
jgi:hypothetical protein